MTREAAIEMIRRQIYGGQPSDDATIGVNLVNYWLNPALGVAAKQNYKDAIAIDGVGYVNNSFYSKFKGLTFTGEANLYWKATLPSIPLGIGENEGISTIELYDPTTNQVSRPFVSLTEKQRSFFDGMRPIPNKILYYYNGNILYAKSTLLLNLYTANVTMVSGGDMNDLESELNIPPDYFPVMIEYIKQQLGFELSRPVDRANEGEDVNPTA